MNNNRLSTSNLPKINRPLLLNEVTKLLQFNNYEVKRQDLYKIFK